MGAASLGALTGGIIGVWLFAMIWEWALFKRVMNDPVMGKGLSVACSYLTASTVYGFASARGAAFNPAGFLIYLPGLFVIGIWWGVRGMNLRNEAYDYGADDNERLKDTFD